MIAIPRSLVRQLLNVFRRAGFNKPSAVSKNLIRFRASGEAVRIQGLSEHIAIEYHQPGPYNSEELAAPFALLVAAEGRSEDVVTLDSRGEGKVSASWTDRGIPQILEFEVASGTTTPQMPDTPASFEPNSPELRIALQAATTIVERERTRYALDCLQLRGREGTIVATDGRQVLVQSGFQFPWSDELLVPATAVLTCRELAQHHDVWAGIVSDWIALRFGPWTIWLKIEREAHFPKIDDLIRKPTAASSTLSIESLDAEFLKVSLERLPCDDNLQPSITLDLNGQIIVRGKPAGQTRPTELILSRSQWQGDQVAVNMNRQYLARALKLGFREVCLFGPNAPVLCDDGRRQYMWALLDAEATIRPCDQAIRIESLTQAVRPPTPSIQSTQKRFNVTTPATKLPSMRRQPRPAGHQQAIDDNNGNRSSTMVNQAIAVRTMLRETLIHTNELIRGLKRELRQNRLLASTLTSLKQLQKVAG